MTCIFSFQHFPCVSLTTLIKFLLVLSDPFIWCDDVNLLVDVLSQIQTSLIK